MLERITEQILVVVAETSMRCEALKEKGFCARDIHAELAGAKFY